VWYAQRQKEGIPRQGIAHRGSLKAGIHRRKSQKQIRIKEGIDNFCQKLSLQAQFIDYTENSKVSR
jgi:hypothetical protein